MCQKIEIPLPNKRERERRKDEHFSEVARRGQLSREEREKQIFVFDMSLAKIKAVTKEREPLSFSKLATKESALISFYVLWNDK